MAMEFDGTTHFNALLSDPNLHAAFSFRTQAEIDQHTHGSGSNTFVYDPMMNAAKLTIPSGFASVPQQLRPSYRLIDQTTGDDEVSIQWEARWSSDWLDVESQGLINQKAFQIARVDGVVDERHIELQTRFNRTDATAVAIPTIRTYAVTNVGGDGISNPLTASGNWQPGGETITRWNAIQSASNHLEGQPDNNPFVILANKWVRFTASITFTGGVQRLRVWMQHEDESTPTLVIADPADASQGFLIDGRPLNGTDTFWVEFNSSQIRGAGSPELVAWIRNLVVFKNETVPSNTGDPVPEPPPKSPQSQTFTIHIAPKPPVEQPKIVSELPSPGQVRQPYSHTFRAVGGVRPYRWMSSGQLPTGLSLQLASKPDERILSGTPTSIGDFQATVWPENADVTR